VVDVGEFIDGIDRAHAHVNGLVDWLLAEREAAFAEMDVDASGRRR
jgi:hypothetical protein